MDHQPDLALKMDLFRSGKGIIVIHPLGSVGRTEAGDDHGDTNDPHADEPSSSGIGRFLYNGNGDHAHNGSGNEAAVLTAGEHQIPFLWIPGHGTVQCLPRNRKLGIENRIQEQRHNIIDPHSGLRKIRDSKQHDHDHSP